MSLRDKLRGLTLGAPPRQMRKVLVPLRDATKPRLLETELDAEGKPKLEGKTDKKKRPVLDDDGRQVMHEVQRYRYPRLQLEDGSPAQVEVREPGLKQRSAIYRAAGLTAGEESEIDMAQLQVEAVIALTYEPGSSNVKIFDEKDKPALLAQLAGGFADDIFEVAMDLMNAAKEEEVAKN
jgi:hypothetical protein